MNLLRGHAIGGTMTVEGGGDLAIADTAVTGEVFAVVSPRAVALHIEEPHGSPRNRWLGTITDLDVVGDRVMVRIDSGVPIVAEVTPAAVRELELAPGVRVWSATKATEIDVYEA
jgi:molybdate transport system ATP-binding protein